jgi:hypothetical protein
VALEGHLDPLCDWSSFEKCGLDWWLRLEPYLTEQFHEYVKKQRTTMTAVDKVEIARKILAATENAKIEMESTSKRNKLRVIPRTTRNRISSLEKSARWATGYDPVHTEDAENSPDDSDTFSAQLLWDSAINSHSFARFIINDAFSMEWPSTVQTCEAEYPKQFIDTFHVMYDLN